MSVNISSIFDWDTIIPVISGPNIENGRVFPLRDRWTERRHFFWLEIEVSSWWLMPPITPWIHAQHFFGIWIEFDDIISTYSVNCICQRAIFSMTHTDKAYPIVFFYRKSSSARWGIIPNLWMWIVCIEIVYTSSIFVNMSSSKKLYRGAKIRLIETIRRSVKKYMHWQCIKQWEFRDEMNGKQQWGRKPRERIFD